MWPINGSSAPIDPSDYRVLALSWPSNAGLTLFASDATSMPTDPAKIKRHKFSRRLKYAWRILSGSNTAVLTNHIRGDDVLIAGYPKSGNNWVEWLVCQMLWPDREIDWSVVRQRVRGLNNINHMVESKLQRMPSPRIFRMHNPYDPRFRRVIMIVRDPRDIALSYYHHFIRLGELEAEDPVERFIEDFVAGRVDRYGPWGENVGSWLGARRMGGGFTVVKYEDLIDDTLGQLRRLQPTLEVDLNDEQLARVVEQCSADRMRSLEHTMPKANTKPSKKGHTFVRAAKKGGGREQLSAESIERITSAWRPIMDELGYLTAGD